MSLMVLVHQLGMVWELRQEKSRPHRHGIDCQKIRVQQKRFTFHELCSFLTNLLRKVTSRTWIRILKIKYFYSTSLFLLPFRNTNNQQYQVSSLGTIPLILDQTALKLSLPSQGISISACAVLKYTKTSV